MNMTNKTRVLYLLQYLKEQSDEGKAVTNTDIKNFFLSRGEKVTLPTIRDDIASLREAGYDISVREMNGVATYYKFLDREWTLPEIQILIDAVSSGQFISPEKSRQMIQKLKQMAGPTEREQLDPGILVSEQVKAPNEQILYIIQAIKDAIQQDEQICFQHYEYDEEKERIPKHDGYVYAVSPYALIWKKDRYYLVGWSEKHQRITHFRIDRMGMPKSNHKYRRPVPEDLRLEDHTDKIFSMFDGPEETVTLHCKKNLIGQVIDQFGDGIQISKTKDDMLDITVTVHLSPTFYGWLFQYVGEMTVIAPEHVCRQYAEKMETGIDDMVKYNQSSLLKS
jgi:predicted DNA-binding transcriptional regulator YafY